MTRIRAAHLAAVGGAAAVANARTAWRERRGVWLRIEDEVGRVGVGEASPLPGFGDDDLDRATHALRQMDWIGREVPAARSEAFAACTSIESPSARFAAETALSDLAARAWGEPLWRFWGGTGEPVLLSALVELEGALEAAKRAAARGIVAVKLKIGRPGRAAEEDLTVGALRAALPELELRLDANGALALDCARARLAELSRHRVTWIEEPVAPSDLPALLPAPLPVALDESLPGLGAEALAALVERRAVAALVCKPALLGGASRGLALGLLAGRSAVPVVVTHLFDGPIALAAAAHLALALSGGQPGPGRAHGLDRHAALFAYPPLELPMLCAASISALPAPGLGVHLPEGIAWQVLS